VGFRGKNAKQTPTGAEDAGLDELGMEARANRGKLNVLPP